MEPITVSGPKSGINGSTKWSDFDKKKNFLVDVKSLCKKMVHYLFLMRW